jgi:O-antigen ligase
MDASSFPHGTQNTPYLSMTPDRLKSRLIAALIGFSPPLLMLITWSNDPFSTTGKQFGFAIWLVEITITIFALAEGGKKFLPRTGCNSVPVLAMIGLITVAIGTLGLKTADIYAITYTAVAITHVLFTLSVYFFCKTIMSQRYIIEGYLYGFIISSVLFIIYAINAQPGYGWVNGIPGFRHIRHLGYYTAAISAMAIGYSVVARGWRRHLTVCIISLSLAASLWTGSRGAVLAPLASVVLGLAIFPRFRSKSTIITISIAAVAALILAASVPAPAPFMGVGRTVNAAMGQEAKGVDTGRVQIWRDSVRAIRQQPLLGHSLAPISTYTTQKRFQQPHSILLQIPLSWGLFGTMLTVVLAVIAAKRTIEAGLRGPSINLSSSMTVIAISIFALYDGALFYTLPVSIFAASLAALWSQSSIGN